MVLELFGINLGTSSASADVLYYSNESRDLRIEADLDKIVIEKIAPVPEKFQFDPWRLFHSNFGIF